MTSAEKYKLNKPQVLHLMIMDKFIPRFVEFVDKNFKGQTFLILGRRQAYDVGSSSSVINHASSINVFKIYLSLLREMNRADKIIVHGLINKYLVLFLFLHRFFIHKIYWAMWGGDVYFDLEPSRRKIDSITNFLRRRLIKRIKYFITCIPEDFIYLKNRYGVSGIRLNSFTYLSNVFNSKLRITKNENVTILLGNSADPSNHHIEMIEKLQTQADSISRLIIPLTYGDANHAREVEEKFNLSFAEKAYAMRNFVPFHEYIMILEQVDIAIFNHRRQQALGNIVQLLGMGKAVYLRKENPLFSYLTGLGLKIFDLSEFNLTPIDYKDAQTNHNIIKKYFSEENLRLQLKSIFDL